MKSWFAIYVRSKQEQKVFERLEKTRILTFLPKIEVVKSYSDRKKIKLEVLFKSYVFVKIDLLKVTTILQIVGVVKFVKFEGNPVPIPEAQIEAVRKFIDTGQTDLVNEEVFLLGEQIEVIKGPFKGQQGRLIKTGQKEMVVMELEVLNRYIPLQIKKSSLKKMR